MTHLEHYVDCLKLFPADFARDMSLLQSLDVKLHSINQSINHLQEQLLNMAHDPNNDWAHEIQLAMQHQNHQSNSQSSNQMSNQSNNHIHGDQIPNPSPGPSNSNPNGQPNNQPNSQPNGHPNHQPNHNNSNTTGNPPTCQPSLITIRSHPHFIQMLSELRHREQIAAALSEEKLNLASAIKENVSSYVHRLESEKSMFESEMGSELVKEAVASVDQKAKRSSFGTNQSSHQSASQSVNPIKKRISTTLKQEKLYVNRERERDRVKAQDLRVSDAVDFDAFEMNEINQSINLSDFAAEFHMQDDSLLSSMHQPISQLTSHTMSLPPMSQNEPVYCFCRMPDFGEEMILCDQNDGGCNEWFHFSCVKLTKKPKRRWLCPECRKK